MRYTIKDGQVFGYSENQDELYQERIEKEGHEPATEQQIQKIINPPKTLDELAEIAQGQVNREYEKRMGELAKKYPPYERETWPVQIAEANIILGGAAGVATPFIDECAAQRGMLAKDVAQLVVQKDAEYRKAAGFLTGVRQWHEECIGALLKERRAEVYAELEAYDYMQGWEPEQASQQIEESQ